MGNFLDLSAGIITRLAAASVAPVGGVYFDVAPKEVVYPYIVINFIAGGEDNFTSVDTRNEIWQVKAISNAAATARTLQNSIRGALHKQESNLSVTGYGVMWCRAELPFAIVEDLGDQLIYHRGWRFRIRLNETS